MAKVVHITAHLGGGVGEVVTNIARLSKERHGVDHELACLESLLPARMLDESPDNRAISFLKAGDKGMEMQLLKGAQEALCNGRPRLPSASATPRPICKNPHLHGPTGARPQDTAKQHSPAYGDSALYCYHLGKGEIYHE